MAKAKANRKPATAKQMKAGVKTLAMLADPNAPVDCDALLSFITAAQSLYTEHCPIAAKKKQ